MEEVDLNKLTSLVDQLIRRVEQLSSENQRLLAQEQSWHKERFSLIEKNEMARKRVEAMILRLKALEQD